MTKQKALDIQDILDGIEELKAEINELKNARKKAKKSDDCLSDLTLIKEQETEDDTIMYSYEGTVCGQIPVIVTVEKHEAKGIRLENLNGIPGQFLVEEFKDALLSMMHNELPELQ